MPVWWWVAKCKNWGLRGERNSSYDANVHFYPRHLRFILQLKVQMKPLHPESATASQKLVWQNLQNNPCFQLCLNLASTQECMSVCVFGSVCLGVRLFAHPCTQAHRSICLSVCKRTNFASFWPSLFFGWCSRLLSFAKQSFFKTTTTSHLLGLVLQPTCWFFPSQMGALSSVYSSLRSVKFHRSNSITWEPCQILPPRGSDKRDIKRKVLGFIATLKAKYKRTPH